MMRGKLNVEAEMAIEVAPERGSSTKRSRKEKTTSQASDTSAKKKKGFPALSALKRLFSSRKHKAKDDSLNAKAKSLDELEPQRRHSQDGNMSSQGKCVSADSVFHVDKSHGNTPDFTRSMEALHTSHFTNELARKITALRGDDSDEGLPSSPPTHSSIADVFSNGLKEKSQSLDSDRSFMSMDSDDQELEDDFFKEKWVSSSAKKTPDRVTDIDLDMISSNSSLNMSAAKHRISVAPSRPKRSGAPSGARGQRRKPAQKATAGPSALPQVKEEEKAAPAKAATREDPPPTKSKPSPLKPKPVSKPSDKKPKTKESAKDEEVASAPKQGARVSELQKSFKDDAKKEQKEESNKKLRDEPRAVSVKPEGKKGSVKEEKKNTGEEQEKEEKDKEQNQKADASDVQEDPKSSVIVKEAEESKEKHAEKSAASDESSVVRLRPVGSVKQGSSNTEQQVSPKKSPVPASARQEPTAVILRGSNAQKQDKSKRQTFAGTTSMGENLLSEGKPGNRSSLADGRAWDDLDKPKEKSPSKEDEDSGTEFASMVQRFKRNASQRKVTLEQEAETLKQSSTTKSSVKGATSPRNSSEMSAQKTVAFAEKADAKQESNASTSKQEKDSKAAVHSPTEKNSDANMGKYRVKTIDKPRHTGRGALNITSSFKEASGSTSTRESSKDSISSTAKDSKRSSQGKDTNSASLSSGTDIESSKGATSKVAVASKRDSAETTEEQVVSGSAESNDKSPYKRESPMQKDRIRSQTQPLPNQLTVSSEMSPSGRRRALSSGNDEKTSPSKSQGSAEQQQSGLVRSSTSRPAPGKLTRNDNNSSGGQPAWVRLAQEKTKACNDVTKDTDTKKSTTNNNEEPGTSGRPLSSVKGMIQNWGK